MKCEICVIWPSFACCPCCLQTSASFQKQAVMLIIGLMLAHVVCFVVSLVTINSQAQYMKEVDDAGDGVMAMHKIAIECR